MALGFFTEGNGRSRKVHPITASQPRKARATRPTKLRLKQQLEPNCETSEAQILPINYSLQNTMTTWSQKEAKAAAKVLEPYVGERVLLYGGGGQDPLL